MKIMVEESKEPDYDEDRNQLEEEENKKKKQENTRNKKPHFLISNKLSEYI